MQAQTPVTFFPVGTQRQLEQNRERIRAKPYAHLFDERLTVPRSVLPRLSAPIAQHEVLPFVPAALNTLLEPGYQQAESGYCELPDGTGYTASLVDFPGCTGAMLEWWMWWHAMEAERYTLWYPTNHVQAVPQISRDEIMRRQGAQRYLGVTHHVDEWIGPELMKVAIEFVDPAEFGLDTSRFAQAGIVAHACARVWLRTPKVGAAKMIHLARKTERGFELRSRYWLAHEPELGIGSLRLSLEPFATWLGIKRKLAGARMAYEQLLHDQIEFTHLATFLARAYAEFGDGVERAQQVAAAL
ncbi:MAG: hypothetical protein ABW352_06880 [Polyangiales bacterium]